MKIKIILLLLIGFLLSCTDSEDENNDIFNVTVLRQGDKCGLSTNHDSTLDFLVEFNENYNNLPNQSTRIYYASNLPEEFKVEGLQIRINFREPNNENPDEIMTCAEFTGGDDFPQIWVISVE